MKQRHGPRRQYFTILSHPYEALPRHEYLYRAVKYIAVNSCGHFVKNTYKMSFIQTKLTKGS